MERHVEVGYNISLNRHFIKILEYCSVIKKEKVGSFKLFA